MRRAVPMTFRTLAHRLAHGFAHRLAHGLAHRLARGFGRATGIAVWLFAVAAHAQPSPQDIVGAQGLSYLTAFGPRNYSVVTLLYATMIVSLAVIAIIGGLVLVGSLMRRARPVGERTAEVAIEQRSGRGLGFIYIGLIPTFLVLLATVIWNYVVLADVAAPPRKPAVTISVIGHQWWWEVRYHSEDASRAFTTANEIHIPVKQPVRVELTTDDVIHSFWVPALTGKTDTIPGQQNVTWLQADRPGIYRGQCTEYCGQQHANMGFLVVADPPDQFQAWWDRQLEPPAAGASEPQVQAVAQGEAVFMRRCAICHSVLGTDAHGRLGPDLSHLMERHAIAAATIPNSAGYLSAWISDPQRIKPGNMMPTLAISPPELAQLRAFLQSLR
jgi:cytochrome c oxidase subunit II